MPLKLSAVIMAGFVNLLSLPKKILDTKPRPSGPAYWFNFSMIGVHISKWTKAFDIDPAAPVSRWFAKLLDKRSRVEVDGNSIPPGSISLLGSVSSKVTEFPPHS